MDEKPHRPNTPPAAGGSTLKPRFRRDSRRTQRISSSMEFSMSADTDPGTLFTIGLTTDFWRTPVARPACDMRGYSRCTSYARRPCAGRKFGRWSRRHDRHDHMPTVQCSRSELSTGPFYVTRPNPTHGQLCSGRWLSCELVASPGRRQHAPTSLHSVQ